jgi:hypothetical protein
MPRFIRVLSAAILLSVTLTGVASAGPFLRLRIEDTGLGIGAVLSDNSPGDFDPAAGAISFSGSIGNFVVNVTTGVSQPLLGGIADFGQLDLNSINVAASSGGTLRITLEDAGYTGPTGFLIANAGFGGVFSGPAGSTIQVQTWANGAEVVPALGPDQPVGAIGAIGGIPAGSSPVFVPVFSSGPGPGALAGLNSTVFDNGAAASFSLFSQVVVNITGFGSTSFDLRTTVVPEPASFLLFGTGLVGWGVLRRRQRPRG